MGYDKNKGAGSGGKRGKRGSVDNAGRLNAFARASSTTGADWGGASAEKIQGVIIKITELGGAVTFGLSRDKGAHSVTLMLDGDRQTLWFNGDAILNDELENVMGTLEAMET